MAPLTQDEEPYEARTSDAPEDTAPSRPVRRTRSGRRSASYAEPKWDDDDEPASPPRTARPRRSTRVSRSLADFVASDDEEEEDDNADYAETMRARSAADRAARARRRENLMQLAASRSRRTMHDEPSSQDSDEHADGDEMPGHRSYSFRARKKVNYALVPPAPEPLRDGFGRRLRRSSSRSQARGRYDSGPDASDVAPARFPRLPALPMSLHAAHPGVAAVTEAMDSSDDETPRAAALGAAAPSAGVLGGGAGAMLDTGGAAASNGLGSSTDALGRWRRDADPLADVDPLGVPTQVDFTAVGGLEHHVQQLKEMVSLPLLYPEVFQRFGVTPPRGVLFHGPPGTGKTLVARALAASCSSEGQPISFFMRKGADCLSKWVGEAERQLRLLFDEAKRCQPSIIFFDEIDGLAPVRSSKQDQIHASIVSTLLALMDGMDGRGQVVVIGATNRPDAVDPALRRPGRFDREFYFPLPTRAARRAILDIHTRAWDPPVDERLKEVVADATTGYGGADLRALCTEATLNAIQRRYPQVYHTNERLLLAPETICVSGADFILALENMVPSSARSASAPLAPLPAHLVPLLGAAVDGAVAAAQRLLPRQRKRRALEEAMLEPLESEALDGAAHMERELLQQSMAASQVYRPRLLLHGARGAGQAHVAEALLHALESYHLVTLNVALLLGDSAQAPEAVLVQQVKEAQRRAPSVLYVPDLDAWPDVLSTHAAMTLGVLLQQLGAQDGVLLVATSSTPWDALDPALQALFGAAPWSRMALVPPTRAQRAAFFRDVAEQAARPPPQWPDAVPRRARVLDELPRAPPRPPRAPTATEARQQSDDDARVLEHLKFRLGTVLSELRKKYKKFSRNVWEEYNLPALMEQFDWKREKGKVTVKLRYERDARDSDSDGDMAAEGGGDASAGGDVGADTDEEADASADPADAASSMDGAVALASSAASRLDVDVDANANADADADADADENDTYEAPAAGGDAGGADGGASADESGADGAPDAPAAVPTSTMEDGYVLRDFTIYTMTLDKMQKRLYQNQYLTVDMFLDDVHKMVCNAEQAREVDSDRVFRAHQMENFATILLDQYVDAPFRQTCAAMAARVQAREAAAREAAASAAAQAVHPRRPNGLRYSARVQGEQPEAPDVDISVIERSHKRPRAAVLDAAEASDDDGAKRPRVGEATPDVPGDVDAAPRPAPPAPPAPVLDAAQCAALVDSLCDAAHGLSVDELEHARAACFERIVAHRASYDKSDLVSELELAVRALQAPDDAALRP